MKKRIAILSIIILLSCNGDPKNVYICTGPKSKSYHKTEKCEGLRSCSREVKGITKDKAVQMRRKPCRYCYN